MAGGLLEGIIAGPGRGGRGRPSRWTEPSGARERPARPVPGAGTRSPPPPQLQGPAGPARCRPRQANPRWKSLASPQVEAFRLLWRADGPLFPRRLFEVDGTDPSPRPGQGWPGQSGPSDQMSEQFGVDREGHQPRRPVRCRYSSRRSRTESRNRPPAGPPAGGAASGS